MLNCTMLAEIIQVELILLASAKILLILVNRLQLDALNVFRYKLLLYDFHRCMRVLAN